jgi:hypothetical protein
MLGEKSIWIGQIMFFKSMGWMTSIATGGGGDDWTEAG